jgi:hypothetical protein
VVADLVEDRAGDRSGLVTVFPSTVQLRSCQDSRCRLRIGDEQEHVATRKLDDQHQACIVGRAVEGEFGAAVAMKRSCISPPRHTRATPNG